MFGPGHQSNITTYSIQLQPKQQQPPQHYTNKMLHLANRAQNSQPTNRNPFKMKKKTTSRKMHTKHKSIFIKHRNQPYIHQNHQSYTIDFKFSRYIHALRTNSNTSERNHYYSHEANSGKFKSESWLCKQHMTSWGLKHSMRFGNHLRHAQHLRYYQQHPVFNIHCFLRGPLPLSFLLLPLHLSEIEILTHTWHSQSW